MLTIQVVFITVGFSKNVGYYFSSTSIFNKYKMTSNIGHLLRISELLYR